MSHHCTASAIGSLASAALQAELRVLQDGQEKSITAELVQPKRLVPVHIQNQPPTYFIIAGLVFTQVQPPATT